MKKKTLRDLKTIGNLQYRLEENCGVEQKGKCVEWRLTRE